MRQTLLSLAVALVAAAAGCSESPSTTAPNATSETSSATDTAPSPATDSPLAAFLLEGEPEEQKSVLDARKSVKDGDDVVLIGRVGGSTAPIVKGRATFTIADTSFKPCNETGDDGCPTPWDYCCEAGINKGLATVKIVGEDGKTLPVDVRDGLGLKELQTVVVKGKAKRDEAGNLTVQATGVYVHR